MRVTTSVMLFIAQVAQAQGTGKIEGQVFRADKKEPYVGLVVELTSVAEAGSTSDKKRPLTSTVDAKGNYSFSGLVPGKYVLSTSVKSDTLESAPCRPSGFLTTTPEGFLVATARTADGKVVQVFTSSVEVKEAETLKKPIGVACK